MDSVKWNVTEDFFFFFLINRSYKLIWLGEMFEQEFDTAIKYHVNVYRFPFHFFFFDLKMVAN